MLGVVYEKRGEEWRCHFTEAQAKGFMLLRIFLHELGHHVDKLRSKKKNIISIDGKYRNNNSNLFIKPAFELWEEYAGGGEAIPVLIEHGLYNRFESCRNEKNSLTFARILNDSIANEFDISYGGIGQIDDQSTRPSSYAVTR